MFTIVGGTKYQVSTDDIIAGYTISYGQKIKIIISSLDSDFFQLITDNVSMLRYRGKNTVICTPEYIKEKYTKCSALSAVFNNTFSLHI